MVMCDVNGLDVSICTDVQAIVMQTVNGVIRQLCVDGLHTLLPFVLSY